MGAPDNWGYLYAPHGRRGNSTLVVSVDHTVSSLNAAHRSQKSSFGLTADKIVGYKGNPSILRHRAWGNEGLDNPEVPYAVDECTRGHESNPLGPNAAQSTANQTFRRLLGRSMAWGGVLAFGGELGCYESSKQQEEVD